MEKTTISEGEGSKKMREAKRSLITYEECEAIWAQFNRIPKNVSLKKRIYYICASSERSDSSIKRIISAYQDAEAGKQPSTTSSIINNYARMHFGIDNAVQKPQEKEADERQLLEQLVNMGREIINRLERLESQANKKRFLR